MELSTKQKFIILTLVLITVILVVTLSIVFTKNDSQTDFDDTTSTFSSKLVSIDQGDLEGIVIKDLNNAVEFYNIPYRRFLTTTFHIVQFFVVCLWLISSYQNLQGFRIRSGFVKHAMKGKAPNRIKPQKQSTKNSRVRG